MQNVITELKQFYPELTLEILKEFLDTHYVELSLIPELDILELFKEWAWAHNYVGIGMNWEEWEKENGR